MGDQYWIAKTFHGLEEVLANELRALAAENIEVLNRAVKFKAQLWDIYHLAPLLRTAQSLLMELYEFEAADEDALYRGIQQFNWAEWLKKDGTFRIESVVGGENFTHSKYVALKCKDAIADQFMSKFDERPDVSFEQPDLVIHVHIFKNQVRVALNATDEPLFKRGYKLETGKAPLNECLAAGILLKAGLPDAKELHDPMCGSGTFAIEAAMIYQNIAPNLHRPWFGFMGWKDYNEKDFQMALDNVERMQFDQPIGKIYSSDMDSRVLQKAKNNAIRAGVFNAINLRQGDMFKGPKNPISENGKIVLNPPYDERMVAEDINGFYKEIGDSLKNNYQGATCFLITSNKEALKNLGLKPKKKELMFNGGLETTLVQYELFRGRHKDFKRDKLQS